MRIVRRPDGQMEDELRAELCAIKKEFTKEEHG